MAGSIRGVTIKLSADASSAKKELDSLNKTTRYVTEELNTLKKGLKLTGNSGDFAKAMELSKRKVEDAKKALKEYETYYNGILNRDKLTETQLIKLDEKMQKYKNSVKFAEKEFENVSKMKFEIDTQKFESDIKDSSAKVNKLEKEIEALNQTSGKGFNKDNYSQQMEKREQIVEELTRQQKLYNEQLDRMKSNGIDEQSAEYQDLEKSIAECTIAAKKMNDEINQNSTPRLDNAAKQLDNWGKKFESAGKTLTTYVSAPLAAATIGSAKAAMDFEDTFAGVQKTVNKASTEQLNKIKEDIIKMSTVGINGHNAIPILATELNEIAAAGGQLGIEADNISEFTEVIAMLGTATNLVGAEGASTLAKFANVTQMSQEDFDRLGSSIVALGNNFATTEQDIANMAQNIAGAGAQMGLSEADILGISTALSSVGIEAQAGGTAFSKVLIAMKSASTLGFDQINGVIDKTGISLRDLQLMSANDSKSFKELANSLGYTKDELNSMIKSGVQLQNFGEITGRTGEEFKKLVDSNPAEAVDAFISGLQNADNVGESAIEMLQEMGFTEERLRKALLNLASSEDGVTKAVDMSNEAWSDNVALLNEFTTKSETTASKMQVAKQNIIEAGRSMGEVFLPYIASGAEKVSELAQWLAALDDDTKGAIITIGGFAAAAGPAVIAIGKIDQGVSALLKTTSSLKKLLATKGLTLSSIGAPVAIIAGVTAAIGLGIKGYEKYREAQINWSEGMAETALKIKEYQASYKELSDLQSEMNNLNSKIELGEVSGDELENTKQRIDEIKKILEEKYNLDITVSMEQLNEALDKARELKQIEGKSVALDFRDRIVSDKDTFDKGKQNIKDNQKEADSYDLRANAILNAQNRIKELRNQYNEGLIEEADYLEKVDNIARGMGTYMPYAGGKADDQVAATLGNLSALYQDVSYWARYYQDNVDGLTKSNNEYVQSAAAYADYYVDQFQIDNSKGADTSADFDNIALAIKNAGLSANEYSQKIALIQSGQEDFNGVVKAGGETFSKYISNVSANMKKFGASSTEIGVATAALQNGFKNVSEIPKDSLSAVLKDFDKYAKEAGLSIEDIAVGMSLLQSGFNDVQSAINSGDIESVFNAFKKNGAELGLTAEQISAIAEELNLIPEGKKIEIDADGNISLIYDVEEEFNKLKDKECTIILNADGTPAQAVIGDTTYAITNYNAETGTATITADNGQAIANIDLTTGKLTNLPVGETKIKVDNQGALSAISAVINALKNIKPVNVVINTVKKVKELFTGKSEGDNNAEGTSNFPGGRALVNDENTYDPREIIKEPGKAPYIPQGRNVLLDLPPGTQIIRARDTKKLLRNIPHFANGNTDFSQAKDSWSHYKNTHTVTTMQDFAWWSDALTKYRADAEAVKEIDEQLFKLKQDLKKDELEELEFWLDMSWITEEEYYNRLAKFRDENYAQWDKDYKELTLKIHDYNQECFNDWVSDQETALERIESREGVYYDKRLELYQKIKDEAQRQYDEGIITHQTYLDTITDMEDKALEARMAAADKRHNNSMSWIENMDFYDGWGGQNGTKMEALYRVKDNLNKDLANGDITWEDFLEKQSENNKDIYTEFMDTIDSMDEEMQEAHEKRLDLIDESYDKELEFLEKYKDRQIEKVNEVYDAKIEAINKEIEAIQELREIEDEQEQIDNAQKSLSAAQALYMYSRDDDERAELLNEVIRKQNALDDLLEEQSDNQRIRELEAKTEALEDEREARLAQVEADYTAATSKSRHSYNSQIKKAEASYMQSQKSLADAINSNTTVWSNLVNNFSGNSSTVNTVNKGNNTINFSSVNALTTGQIRMLIQSIVGDF